MARQASIPHSGWEILFRAVDRPMHRGDGITQNGGLEIRVDDVRGCRPTRVLFHFPTTLEEGEHRLLVWRRGRIEPLALPAGGASLRLGGPR